MSLNWKEINLILQESRLSGASIRDVVQPDFAQLLIVLSFPQEVSSLQTGVSAGSTKARHAQGKREYNVLRISHKPSGCVMHLSAMRVPKIRKVPRFMELLRARIKGGIITQALQCHDQRIVRIAILQPEGSRFHVWIRLWNNAANTFLTDEDDTIIDCYYRRPQKNEMHGRSMRLLVEELLKKTRASRALPYECSVNAHHYQSYSAMIDERYRVAEERHEREALIALIRENAEQRVASMHQRLSSLSEREAHMAAKYKSYGELLQRYGHLDGQHDNGQREYVTLTDPNSGAEERIPINPRLTIQQNAQIYFKKYKMHKRDEERRNEERERLHRECDALERMNAALSEMSMVELTESRERLAIVRSQRAGAKAQKKASESGMRFHSHGFTILVGTSAEGSSRLMRTMVRGNDMWFHARNVRGSSVFILARASKSIPLETLYDAATLAHYFSKARHSDHIDVLYTAVKHVRQAKHAPQGTFIPFHDNGLMLPFDKVRFKVLHAQKLDDL